MSSVPNRDALPSVLHDVLLNGGLDSQPPRLLDPRMDRLANNYGQFSSGLPTYDARSSFLASRRPSSLDHGLASSFHSEDILLHAEAEHRLLLQQRLLEQKRALLLQQRMLAQNQKRLLLQEQYMSLLRNGLPMESGKPNAPEYSTPLDLLASQVEHQAPAPTVPLPESQAKNSGNLLEVLGGSLRGKSDPYIDISNMEDPDPEDSSLRRTRGGVSEPFPEKLHRMLLDAEQDGKTDVVSFYSHGRAFGIHDPERFVSEIMPKYFKQSKWNSFARQLNLYGFVRITTGPDAGGYYHELFLKGRPNLSFHMRRVGVPQGEDRRKFRARNCTQEPDFYSMKPVGTKSE